MSIRRPPFVLMLGGSSLTAGRLCTPPIPWTDYLQRDMTAHPNCKGQVIIINTGKGSQTSDYGASEAALMAPLRPSHVLMEDFGINDCAIGPVSIPQATANFNSMVASYLAANPNVIIVHQTMSPASAADVNRTNLATYYDNGTTNAGLNGLLTIDNYATWPKPLDPALTVNSVTPTGFAALGGTWNPADKSGNITLSGSDLIATDTGGGGTWSSARGTISKAAGLWYFRFTVNVGTTPVVGISTAALATSDYVGSTPGSYGYAYDGHVKNNGGNLASGLETYTAGDVIGIAFDLTHNKIWFQKNAGFWNNNIAATPPGNTGGIAISAGTYFAGLSTFDTGAQGTGDFAETGDGLHPLWANAFQLYSYPNILAWAISAMAAYWP